MSTIRKLNPRNIIPEGWLADQLEIQKNGLSGNLDKIWRDVRDSAWIGGTAESWERMPYFLDGFIPLGFLTGDEDIKARAKKYVYAIVDKQQPDGWICPCPTEGSRTYDVWALFLIGKVLSVWLEYNDDKKVYAALYKAMKCLYEKMNKGEVTLFDWAKFRWFEALIPLKFLYEVKKENWIKELAGMLYEQGANYPDYFEVWKRPLNRWKQETHVVNIAMALKYEPLLRYFGFKTDKKASDKIYAAAFDYNGSAVGTIFGDECLAGQDPSRGFELCSVAELMYSFETLYELTGKKEWADRLELVAFNALPAALSEDMWTHQYDQQINQISCERTGKPYFGTNSDEANLFGLEPHFGCCTANFNQAWPKFAATGVYKTDRGIVMAMPFSAKYLLDCGQEIEVIGNYPFETKFEVKIISSEKRPLEIKIRIPGWAKEYEFTSDKDSVCDSDGDYIIVNKDFFGVETLGINFTAKPELIKRPNGLKVAKYGPILFSLPIDYNVKQEEYTKDGVERKFPYCDYELFPTSDWNYGFAGELKPEKAAYGKVPFSKEYPRIVLKTTMQKVGWDYAEGYDCIAAKTPSNCKAISGKEEKTLIPYGAAKLRMTEMPIVK